MIRKHFHDIKIVGVLTALLALASCAGDEFDSTKNADGPKFGLTVVTNDQVSTRTPGDDNLNENRFVSIDYFFFAQNSDDNKLLLHKTEGVRNDANNTTLDNSTHTYNGPLSASDLIALFGDTDVEDGTTCYVYVLTNLLPSTRAAIESEKTIWGEDFTLGILKRISFQDTNISANGKQECFVMFGGGEVSLTTDADTNVRTISGNPIRVTRDAAKVVLTVRSLQEEVEVKDADDNVVAKWKSVPDQMHVMFYNGKNKSNVHSQINAGLHYVPEVNDDCYFDLTAKNSGWRNLTAASNDEPYKNLTHAYPFYTYLSDWTEVSGADPDSYMILVVPWQQVDVETGENINAPIATYYQIQTSTTDTYYENYYYHIFIDVGILGSFELPEPEVIEGSYMIVPWGEKNIDATMREPVYLIVEENEFTMNNVSSGSVPYITSHEITEAYVTKVAYKSLKTFVFQSLPTPLNDYGTNNENEYPASLNQSRTVNTYVNNERFDVSSDNGLLTLTHTVSPDQYTCYEVTVRITNSKGLSEDVVFIIYPAIYVDNQPGGNAFINGYFGNVTPLPPHRNNGTWQQNADRSYRVRNNRGGSNNDGNAGNPYHIWAGGAYNYGGNNTEANTYGSLITGAPGLNTTMTRITVTSFTENDEKFNVFMATNNNNNPAGRLKQYTYKITDPRVPSGWTSGDLFPYVVTASSQYNAAYTTQSWTNAGSIMVGTSEIDKIAPEFLVTSAWGRCNPNSITFAQAQKRCATYQEAGYPAGRWRLPTVAEISYIHTLQQKGIIDNLFSTTHTGGYWSSEGHPVRYYNGNPTLRTTYTGTDPVRCVYDIWYWGEEKMTTNEYHANPTK